MAQTLHANLSQFQETVQVAFYEKQYELFDYFNANSGGAFSLSAGEVIGKTPEFGFFQDKDTGGQRDLTSASLRSLSGHVQSSMKGIVISGNEYDDASISALKQQGIDPMSYAAQVGQNMAEHKLQRSFTRAISTALGTIEKQSTTYNDISALSSGYAMSVAELEDTKDLMGDHAGGLVVALMHSKMYKEIKKEVGGFSAPSTITNIAQGILMSDILSDILGMMILVTDNSALKIAADSVTVYDRYKTLLLFPNAVTITEDETIPMKTWEDDAYDNALIRSLTEYNQTVVARGFSYTGGTMNPTNAQLATTSNWTAAAASVKGYPGVKLQTRVTV